jgi:aspartyl protease family protein
LDADRISQLIYLGILLLAIGGWVIVEYRTRLGLALRSALAWGMIFVAIMAGYGLWGDLRRDITPRQMVTEAGELVLPQAQDGHYYMNILIDGKEILFLADTGATNIVLNRSDAEALGIDVRGLPFLGNAMTANGEVRTARVKLAKVVSGPFQDNDVTAWVNEGEMDTSLLGMDYLGLFIIKIGDGQMVLSR